MTGAAVALGPNVNSLFKQLGIYNDYVKLAKVCHSIDNYNEERELTFSMDFRPLHVMYGAGGDQYISPMFVPNTGSIQTKSPSHPFFLPMTVH